MPLIKLLPEFKTDVKSHIADLHSALTKLNLPVSEETKAAKKIDEPTIEVIKKLQEENKLPATGSVDSATVAVINDKLHDQFVTANKYRTANLQELLTKVNIKVDPVEVSKRTSGDSTRKAIEAFQQKMGLPVDGNVSEDVLNKLHNEVIKQTLTTKTQQGTLLSTLQKVNKISKLAITIAPDEIKNKQIGVTAQSVIKAFQNKYKLPATGEVDKATLNKLTSVAASKGTTVKLMSAPPATELTTTNRELRINKTSKKVTGLQKSLAYLGYKIADTEYKTQTFGATTREAILQYQKKKGVAVTGHADKATLNVLNSEVQQINPQASATTITYCIRGSVRDEMWRRKANMVVKVYEKTLTGESVQPLAAKKNFLNGFFNLRYAPPINPMNGQIKDSFHLVIKLFDVADQNNPLAVQTHYNVNQMHWVNFTAAKKADGTLDYNAGDYKGDSEFGVTLSTILLAGNSIDINTLKETADDKHITQLSVQTGLSTDDIMQVVLAHHVAATVNVPATLTPEVFYSFIVQNLPPDLPADLLRSTSEWETINQLIELASSGIVFLDYALQKQALENAVTQNFVSQTIKLKEDAILAELKNQRTSFTLTKPILTGNGSLQSLLQNSQIDQQHYPTVASVFINNKGVNAGFWDEIKTQEATIGADAINDFATTVETGNISKNHTPTVSFLKQNIGEGKMFVAPSDIAKLDQLGLVNLINQNPGEKFPANMPGNSDDEKVANYAAALKSRSEFLYPAVSLVATVKRSGTTQLQNINEVQNFIDTQKSLDFRKQNIDKYLADNAIQLDPKVKEEVKIVQRISKITTSSDAGSTLINAGLHSSMQIYFTGKERLTSLMTAKNVDSKQASRVYELSKLNYLQILKRFLDFRPEVQTATPAAIAPQTYTAAEIQQALGDIPNLDSLFGSLDYCDCEECKSLYGPAAYLTDVLRFLKEHLAIDITKTVKDVLFDRRPDLGNILLNCENTDTPLPYIDLVCEILENNIVPPNQNFSFQTTLTGEELRATPEHIRTDAYTILATADFPMNNSFNLFEEESRTYLNFLRVPRFELMETFQNTANPAFLVPDDVSIAAEYFSMSSKEKNLVITQRQTNADQDTYWNTDTTQTSLPVSLFIKRTKLSYSELLELLLVRFVNDPAVNKSEVQRPGDSCDTSAQSVINLTVSKFDLMHRFVRLWRKTGWKMWELDLLLRNSKIGNSSLDGNALVNLKRFKQLQEKLNLPFETVLAFYGDINTEGRVKPDKPDVAIKPLYSVLFQNIAVTNPIDAKFTLPLDATLILGTNNVGTINEYNPVPTILSALALRQSDFDVLVANTDNHLSLASLSSLLRYAYLARSLKLSVPDLILFLSITDNTDPFADLQTTLDIVKNLQYIKVSGLSLLELDYILNYKPDSPVGLRSESISQLIDTLRKILAGDKDKTDQLHLSDADKNSILSFEADALVSMNDAQFVATFTPLQITITNVSANFLAASFSVAETNAITQYDTSHITAASKAKLVDVIKKIQGNLADLFNQNVNQVKSLISSSFGLTDEQSDMLLTHLALSGTNLLDILTNESLIAKDTDGNYREINTANFPDHFKAYLLLHKVSLLLLKMKIKTENAGWFISHQAAVKTLNFSALPVAPAVAPNDYKGWYNLYLFLSFSNNYPEPENASVRSILSLAISAGSTKADIINSIAALTQWSADELTALDTKLGLLHPALPQSDYANPELYQRFIKCFAQMKLTGVSANTMFDWALVNDDSTLEMATAVQTRNAVKAKYEQEDWLQKITPLHDNIREKKRTALIEYHLENSQRSQAETVVVSSKTIPNPLYWKDSNSLFTYFLIDVEMGACQLTSRIKQALSSVQLFVQRCFLNLENRFVQVTQDEQEDVSSPNAWSQWKWMKNYRVWEANRKIFFYPENWLEPELRDDKSPFFKDLENELMQNEVTNDNVEAAFLNYLQKADEVAHLDVCGLYHETENLTGDESMLEVNIVHVIGRTKAIPHIYYYRNYDMNYVTWSAWEKIDVDITGEQVVPVVYNRKLHLFWLQIIEKPMKAKKIPPTQPSTSSNPQDAPEPMKTMEIQLGWSIKKSGGWTTKKISKQKLIHPWERPHYAYNLKPYYLAKFNELYLDIYLSTSKEFNDEKFYDPSKPASINPVYLTGNRSDETFLPWHSSSFIFDGEVKDVKLKGVGGAIFFWGTTIWWNDSYNYVHDNFGEDGAGINNLQPIEFGPRLKLPSGMHFKNTRLTNNQVQSANSNQLRVLEGTNTATLTSAAISPFELVITQQDLQLDTLAYNHPMFYQDNQRAFFIKPEWQNRLNNYGQVIGQNRTYRFQPFYHPYTVLFIRELNRSGVEGILNRKIQTAPASFAPANTFDFNSYTPASSVMLDTDIHGNPVKNDIVDFSTGGAYSIYNWELFFHAPLLIACRLTQNQKFEDAMKWFHYIFNPTDIENYPTPQRYWITKPFFEYNSDDYRKQRIENILTNINLGNSAEIGNMVAWKNNPFKPHLIARNRPVAYQKNVVMKYLDNLIAWGDMLFKRDTIESINEASLLYMLAYEILGDRSVKVPNVKHEDLTFNDLEADLDAFGNARVDIVIEDMLLPITVVPPAAAGSEPIPKLDTFYFCIPGNDYLTKYWDTVEDRLFKIRNCMNIEGIVRQLPLFEPPIDPALLVKAAAAGIDLSSVLNDLAAPTPHYRFRVVVQKAIEFCNEVKMLGEKLLSAVVNKDAEQLALLRSQHEIQLLEAIKEVRKKQIDEVVETIGSLNKSLDLANEKKVYYESIPRMNDWEIGGVVAHSIGIGTELAATIVNIFGAGISMVPDFDAGVAGFGATPTAKLKFGGTNFGNAASKVAEVLRGVSAVSHATGSLLETQASYTRRDDENKQQASLATIEMDQIQFQINAAQIRQAIAEKELDNQDLQIDNAKIADDYMRNKYTNDQLYSWMITQISTVYFQSYQLAFDMAKKAEKCFQYELGIADSNIIQFGYWDSLKKGLLSGDKLMNDLRRLDAEYINQNRREFEITKHISLLQMMPLSLITLKETGMCTISLPEWLYDMDYPGHYMRRIKNVSVSIPCIVGPFTSVNCTLSLLRNETRVDSILTGGNTYDKQEDDDRFRTMFGEISSIATSSGQNDSGIFELNFNDDRYLPFEGAGAISTWQISMPKENNYFDFDSLSDVVLHIQYTSRNGGGSFTAAANTSVQAALPNSSARLFSLKHDFATEWYKFLNPQGRADQEFVITLRPEHFAFFMRGRLSTLQIKKLDLFIDSNVAGNPDFTANIKITNTAYIEGLPASPDNFNTTLHVFRDNLSAGSLGEIRMKMKVATGADFKSLASEDIGDVFLLLQLGL